MMANGGLKMNSEFHTDGTLIVMDLWGVNFDLLNDPSFLSREAKMAAEKAQMQVLAISIVPFKPQGLSLAVILGESHLTIHTSPEQGYAAIDIFTCGKGNPLTAAEYLRSVLNPTHVFMKNMERGVKPFLRRDKPERDFQLRGVDHARR
jgi:S-adenosylmethionine decarboxylase